MKISKEAEQLTAVPVLKQQLSHIQKTLQQMTTAVQQKDKATIAILLQDLSKQQQQLAASAKAQEV